ncbi:universal stress protein [Lewinella sp. IMCC34191]|uniref:universal stress protein n=1 Tax=Lewinella sp. IMCC34191 TaxID=2259172 RepID=UPI000E2832D0|nr:universal stress protein [Lewinella sp. IMCC34191]
MSHLLIPVDFSQASHDAYRYGLHVAKARGLDVILVHYYSGSIDPRANLYIGGDGSIQGSFEARLREFAYRGCGDLPAVEPPTGVEVTYETGVSLRPAVAISKRAGEADVDLVVMPARSSASLLGKWLGSTTSTVSETCNRPVLIVPPGYSYRPVGEIVVADNRGTAGSFPFAELSRVAEVSGSRLHMVHVHRTDAEILTLSPFFGDRAAAHPDDPAITYRVAIVNQDDISQGLLTYADRIDADLIVIFNRTRRHWQALLRATLTQDLAQRSTRPVLVLHETFEVPATGERKNQNTTPKHVA